MATQLIYSVQRLFVEGRELPNWRLSVLKGVAARLVIKSDRHDGENLRSLPTLCAALFHPTNGLALAEIPKLYDVHLLSMTSDELIIAGIERPEGLITTHYAQTWRATPIELTISPEWTPGGDPD